MKGLNRKVGAFLLPFVIGGGLPGVGIGVIWIPHYPAVAPTRVAACPQERFFALQRSHLLQACLFTPVSRMPVDKMQHDGCRADASLSAGHSQHQATAAQHAMLAEGDALFVEEEYGAAVEKYSEAREAPRLRRPLAPPH